jgi:hypothetical protein
VWIYSSVLRSCFVVGITVRFPMAVEGSGHNQPCLIAGFDP